MVAEHQTHDVESFLESVETFLASADSWLTDEDSPAVTTLRVLARALDERMNGEYLRQFGLAYRALLKRAPGGSEDGDELDDIIPE